MKKIKYLLLLIAFAMFATGCVKFNANMEIKKDKSMEFSIIYAFDKTLLGEDNALKEEQFDEVKKQGFTVTKYSEGNYEGFKMTKKISNIDEVSTTEDVTYDLSGMMQSKDDNKYIFKVVKGEDKNTYTAKIKFNANDSGMNTTEDEKDDTEDEISTPDETLTTGAVEESNSVTSSTDEIPTVGADDTEESTTITSDGSTSSDLDLSSFTKNLDLSFNVSLPYGAISSNATTKEDDNKKLSWKLGTTNQELMEFTFELKNNDTDDSNLMLYIGIGVGVLLVLVLIILFTRKKGPKEIVPVEDKQVEINNDVDDNVSITPAVEEKAEAMQEKE